MPTIALEDDDEHEQEPEEDDDAGVPEESSSEDEDEDEGDGEELLLGFLEPPVHPELMLRHHFPCKVGGKPAWLNPLCIPPLSALTCGRCKKPLRFLLQINACLEFDETFHRSLLLFICPNLKCLAEGGMAVFRSQLPRANPFYPYQAIADPPAWEGPLVEFDDEEPVAASSWPHLCAVCGLPGPKSCGQCKKAHYCSPEHQRLHWKPVHSALCIRPITSTSLSAISVSSTSATTSIDTISTTSPIATSTSTSIHISNPLPSTSISPTSSTSTPSSSVFSSSSTTATSVSPVTNSEEGKEVIATNKTTTTPPRFKTRTNLGVLYQEREIVIASDEEEEKEEVVRKPIIEEEDATFNSRDWKKLNKNKLSKQFTLFQATVSKAPEQVIRYQRGGKCLWVSAEKQVENVPPCPLCHGPRVFEFQVLPQLLYYLGEVSSSVEESKSALDWGTLAVYTCEKSCGSGLATYFPEYVHLQPHEQ